MKKAVLIVALVVFGLATFGLTPVKADVGFKIVNIISDCSFMVGAFDPPATFAPGETRHYVITVTETGEVAEEFSTGRVGNFPGFIAFFRGQYPNGTNFTVTLTVAGRGTISASTTCNTSLAMPGFFPGDGRVDPKPADRVAVYCSGNSLTVYGIGPDSEGVLLATIPFADIVKAGPAGFKVSKELLGTVSVAVDAQNNFWLAWQGDISVKAGKFYADGNPKNGFAKGFVCAVPK